MPKQFVIFHINTETDFRGGEIQTLHLIQELQKRSHHNLLIAQPKSPLAEKANQSSIPTLEIKMRGESDFVATKRIRKLIRERSPDIVHAHTAHAVTLSLLARIGKKRTHVVSSRRVALPVSGAAISRIKYNSTDAIIAVSLAVKQQLIKKGIKAEKIFIAESGTDFSQFDRAIPKSEARGEFQIPKDAFVIGNVSHFDKNKGQNHLIFAFNQFAAAHPNEICYLLLVGDGPELQRCRNDAKKSRFSNRIIFTGNRSDVQNLYSAIDLFFLSSLRGEGWSGVLREAMGMGLPSIAVNQIATHEQLQEGKIGMLVSDQPSDWPAAIEKMFTNEELRKQFGELGKKSARQFTVDAMVEKTLVCYNALSSHSD